MIEVLSLRIGTCVHALIKIPKVFLMEITNGCFPKISVCSFAILVLIGANSSVRSETITLSTITEGTTTTDLGYNLAHFN